MVVAPTPPIPPVPPTPAEAVTPAVPPTATSLPLLGAIAETLGPSPATPEPRPKPGRDIKISKGKDDKYIATTGMHFMSKVKPGSPFVIRNSLGNIILKPSKDDTCDVKAVIRAEAKIAAEAKEMAEQVSMNIDASDKRYYLKPVKPDDDQWSNLSVDLTIAVPAGVQPDIKTNLGSIELYNLKGPIKVVTDLGSVKAINTSGDLELLTKMGKIEFTAPKDLSAKIRAETKMGSITSDLLLKINKQDMFKRTAEGTIGSGRDTIRLTTDMGEIRIRKYSENSSTNNPMQRLLSEVTLSNSTDKLMIEPSISNAASSKIVGAVQAIKEEQEGNRHILKRIETMTAPLAPGSVLDITNKDGNITVQGSDTNQCLINSTFTIKAPSIEAARELSKKVSLNATPDSKKLVLKTVGPRHTPSNHSYYVNLQITVPRNTSLTLHNEDGNIQIRNLEGQIKIGVEDGDITCENVMANVRLTSEDGNVNIKKGRLAGLTIKKEDGNILCDEINGDCNITIEDGDIHIQKSRLTNLTIKKEDGNIRCDDISGNCDISLEDGDVTIGFAEGMAENCTCTVRGEDGNVGISRGTFAQCQVNRESGMIACDNVSGNLDLKLEAGQVNVDHADTVPENCSITVRVEQGGIRLSAPHEMFPADGPSKAKRKDGGAEWTTKASTPGGGTRSVSLRVDEGSVNVDKR
jgi:DUF4097 and DUF4098 domain-containing protein YvlB